MKRGVFILGMHRSGTSAATRLVNLLGVPTCIEEDLLPATADNPRGYWESASLTAFNDRLLTTLGCDWSCPIWLDTGWETAPTLDRFGDQARGLLPRVFPGDQWVWKDPRNCVTFAFWARYVDADPVAVLVYRNPLEVAASLGARDGFGKPHSLALWERYVRSSLAAIAGVPALVTAYADLLSNPLEWCGLVRQFLSDSGVTTSLLPEAAALEFVDTRLRRSLFAVEDLAADPDVSTPQLRLFDALENLRGAQESFSAPALPPETPLTEVLLAGRRRTSSRGVALRGAP